MKTGKRFYTGFAAFMVCSVIILFSLAFLSCESNDVELDSAIRNITDYKFGDSREPLSVVADLVVSSNGFSSIRQNLEKQFVKALDSDATLDCKDFICRQLALMGTDISVPQLEKMLTVPETSDMARFALETNLSPRVCEALRNALPVAEGDVLIGIINTLGNRKSSDNAGALMNLEGSSDEKVASAVTSALARQANQ